MTTHFPHDAIEVPHHGAADTAPSGLHQELNATPYHQLQAQYAQLRPTSHTEASAVVQSLLGAVAVAHDQLFHTERAAVTHGGSHLITDASVQPVVVNGKTYSDNVSIPGNQPVALRYPDGRPVMGPDGKAVFGPSRADLDQVADQFGAVMHVSPILALSLFGHNAPFDFQRVRDDSRNTVFTSRYRDFANIAVGYAFAASNLSADNASSVADLYCQLKACTFAKDPKKDPRSAQFSALPERDVTDYQIGEALYHSSTPAERIGATEARSFVRYMASVAERGSSATVASAGK